MQVEVPKSVGAKLGTLKTRVVPIHIKTLNKTLF